MRRVILAVVGLGPWGLCVLDRLLAQRRRPGAGEQPVTIHLFEPGTPGAGVHKPDEPDYLLMNTACGQVSLFGAHGLPDDSGVQGLTLYEWVTRGGYQMVGGECRRAAAAGARAEDGEDRRAIEPHDFLPRRVLGEYLAWAYGRLTEELPRGTTIKRWPEEVVDVAPAGDGREAIFTAGGSAPVVTADEVFLTTGHTASRPRPAEADLVPPYPTARLQRAIRPGQAVAIAGMGLVAVDVITALTSGRGGRFQPSPDGRGLRYLPSGEEPRLLLYSRNGLPFCCRPAVSLDTSGSFRATIFSEEALAARRHERQRSTGHAQLDFRDDVLPLLWAEMSALYYERRALLAEGTDAAAAARRDLDGAWRAGSFGAALDRCAARYERFDPAALFFRPDLDRCSDGEDYQAKVRRAVADDVAESLLGEAKSPVKAALELFRVLRDTIRAAVDFGGLTPASFEDFRHRLAPAINRVIIGPPVRRGRELLALMDAGVLRAPLGGAPDLRPGGAGGAWELASTRLATPRREQVDHVVQGYLPQPGVTASVSPLLARLRAAGRLVPFGGGADSDAGGVEVGRDFHPRDAAGRAQERLWILGPLTEGPRYFTHYLPSPRSRVRAFHDADACVRQIWRRSASAAAASGEERMET